MIVFTVLSIVFGCVLTGFLFFRYINILEMKTCYKRILFVFSMLLGLIPALIALDLHFIFASYSIVFAITWIRDLIWVIAFRIGNYFKFKIPSPMSKKYVKKLNIITLIVCFIAILDSFYEGGKVPDYKTITISSDKIKTEKSIVLLSDLHLNHILSVKKIDKIVEKVNLKNPDIVLLSGDIIDDKVQKITSLIASLSNLKAKKGIFFVAGNHEHYIGYTESVNALKSIGFIFVENLNFSIDDDLIIAGIPDYFSAKYTKTKIDIEKIFLNIKNKYKILLSHTPCDFYERNNFDLELSGHTHGGQIFPGHIFAKYFNHSYLAGLYSLRNNAKIYVTRGTGAWGPQMRFFAPSEITVIRLKPLKTLAFKAFKSAPPSFQSNIKTIQMKKYTHILIKN